MSKKLHIMPRVLRLKDVPNYLGTNINFFNKYIRPSLVTVPVGEKQAVGFDRLDLDAWVEENKGCDDWRSIGKGDLLWGVKKRQVFTNVKVSGTSTSNSKDDVFVKAVEQLRLKKRKSF